MTHRQRPARPARAERLAPTAPRGSRRRASRVRTGSEPRSGDVRPIPRGRSSKRRQWRAPVSTRAAAPSRPARRGSHRPSRAEQIVDRLNRPGIAPALNGDEIQVAGQKVVGRRRRLGSTERAWSRSRPRSRSALVGGQTVDPIATPGQTQVHARRIGLGAHRTEPADDAHFVLRDDHDPCEHIGSQAIAPNQAVRPRQSRPCLLRGLATRRRTGSPPVPRRRRRGYSRVPVSRRELLG